MVRSLQEKSMSYDPKSGWIGDKYVPQIGDYGFPFLGEVEFFASPSSLHAVFLLHPLEPVQVLSYPIAEKSYSLPSHIVSAHI